MLWAFAIAGLALMGVQDADAPTPRLTYPDVPLERDPLAPLPESEPIDAAEAVPARPVGPPPCATRGFVGEIELVGPPRRVSPVYLCANSDDPADYRKMLVSAKSQIAFNEAMTFGSRSALVADLDAAIAAFDEEYGTPVDRPVITGR